MIFLIIVEYEVEGDNEKHAINTLVKLAHLDDATEVEQIKSCNIVDVMDRDRQRRLGKLVKRTYNGERVG